MTTTSNLIRHYHITPRGGRVDRLGWRSEHTARKWGRELYTWEGISYRLVMCHSPKCAIYPPVPQELRE